MRYTSPEDARSDLFLSAGVFLFGPFILGLVLDILGILPLAEVPGATVVSSIVCTVLVPFLLIRYRKETLQDYAQGKGTAGVSLGLMLSAPIVGAVLLALLIIGRDALVPVFPVLLLPNGGVDLIERLVSWLGVVALAWYATAKARDTFRLLPQTLREGTLEIGRVLAILAAVTTLLVCLRIALSGGSFDPILLLLPLGPELGGAVLLPLGVAGAVWFALRRLHGPSTTSRSVLLTPTLLLALGGFTLTLTALDVLLYLAAIYGGIGLVIGMLQETQKSFSTVLALALTLALLTPIPAPLRLPL